jgi:diguanylate cyclase (GGDEF)-like protein
MRNPVTKSGNPLAPDSLTYSLFDRYLAIHHGATLDSFYEAIQDGLVLWRDVELKTALKIIGDAKNNLGNDPSGELFKTEELQAIIDRLCSLTMEDGLTGLFNRRYFDHRLAQELHRARRELRPCSIMLADVDNFKRINDVNGHAAGDRVLRLIATILRNGLRSTDDVTSRVGGEEFAVILPGTDMYGARVAAERLRQYVQKASLEDTQVADNVTVSIGLSTFDPRNSVHAPDALVELADRALYQAKAAGKNTVRPKEGLEAPPSESGVTQAEKDDLVK